jgi:drug/metabolite transporter (DMT)-like permease
MWSTAGPLDKMATAQASAPFHGVVIGSGMVIGLLVLLAFERRLGELKEFKGHPLVLVGGMVAGGLALVLQLMAMQLVFVNLVEGFKRVTSLASAALLGKLFFHEEVTRMRLLAIALMAVGVMLLVI